MEYLQQYYGILIKHNKLDVEINKKTMDETTLSPLETATVIGVLEDCITKLAILGHRLPVPAAQPEIVEYQSLEEKYGRDETKKIRSETKSPYSASMVQLQKDRALLEHILKETVEELSENKCYYKMYLKVAQYQREQREDKKLLSELAELSLTAPGLKKELASAKQRAQTELRQSQQTLAKVQDRVARVRGESGSQQALAASWEQARVGQLDMSLTLAEEGIESKLEEVARETDIELRVHAEMETFLEETIQNIKKEEAKWREKFAHDKAEKEAKLAALKEKREKNFNELKNLADLYRQHKKELRAYEAVRLQRQQMLEKMKFENDTATRIQAWWRGIMVRRGLGPYKKKKKPVKDKPKKK